MSEEMTLLLNDFGPIIESKIEISKITVIGGENATGKSTTSKILYCFLRANSARRQEITYDRIIKLIKELKEEEKREKSLSKLSEYYDKNRNLPIYLWYSQGTMAILLQEIISTYKYLSPCKLSQERAVKICNILKLLTSIATHNEIKYKFNY